MTEFGDFHDCPLLAVNQHKLPFEVIERLLLFTSRDPSLPTLASHS